MEVEYDRPYIEKELTAIEKAGGWFSGKDAKIRELLTRTRNYGETETIYPNSTPEQKARMLKLLLGGLFISGENKDAAQKILKAAKEKDEVNNILDVLSNDSKIRDRVKDLL